MPRHWERSLDDPKQPSHRPAIAPKVVRVVAGAGFLAGAMCLLALARWPSEYYTALRVVVCAASVAMGYLIAVEYRIPAAVVVFAPIAMLFNPFMPVYLKKSTWTLIDLAVAVIMLWTTTWLWGAGRKQERQGSTLGS